jgi:tetratricopeptide (TPR) repeat protein
LSGAALTVAGYFNQARERHGQALAFYQEIGSRDGEASCLSGLATVARLLSDYETAREQYRQSLAINREIGRRDGEAACLLGMADVARALGDSEMAREQYKQALVIYKEIGLHRQEEITTCAS